MGVSKFYEKGKPEVCPCVQSLPPACYWEFRAWWNSFLVFSEHLLSSLHYSCVYFILLEELRPDKGLPNFSIKGQILIVNIISSVVIQLLHYYSVLLV